MSSPSEDITVDHQPIELQEPKKNQLESESSTGRSLRTSISFITNDQDRGQNKNNINQFDPMDEDGEEEEEIEQTELNPDMPLKEFVELYLTGPRSMQLSINGLLKELVDAREGFNQARLELQNSKSDISVIHSQFFESRRSYDIINKELNESKILSEQLKSEVKQLKLDQSEMLNEINFKVEQLSRILIQQGQQQKNNQMQFTSPVQFYPHPPQHHFALPIQQQQPPPPPPPPPLALQHPHHHQQQQTSTQQRPPSLQPIQSASQNQLSDSPLGTTNSIKMEHVDQQHPLALPPQQQQQQQRPTTLNQHQSMPFMTHEFQQPNTASTTPKTKPKLSPGSDVMVDSSALSSPVIPLQNLQQQQQLPVSESDGSVRTYKYSLLKQITSIRQIWQEYAYGLNGQPSIKSLQIKYKTKWRYPEDASTFKRRKRIYKAIEIAMLNGLSEEEAITELENHRLDKEGNYRRSLQWLCDNIPDKFRGA